MTTFGEFWNSGNLSARPRQESYDGGLATALQGSPARVSSHTLKERMGGLLSGVVVVWVCLYHQTHQPKPSHQRGPNGHLILLNCTNPLVHSRKNYRNLGGSLKMHKTPYIASPAAQGGKHEARFLINFLLCLFVFSVKGIS